MILPTCPVLYRIHQDGEVISTIKNVSLVLRSRLVGTVGNVPCFSEIRLVDFWDRRRATDRTTRFYRGPVTIEVVSVETGERINLIALADACDVVDHPCGELAGA